MYTGSMEGFVFFVFFSSTKREQGELMRRDGALRTWGKFFWEVCHAPHSSE